MRSNVENSSRMLLRTSASGSSTTVRSESSSKPAGKARYFKAENDAGMAKADLGHQMTEPLPVGGSGFAEVAVDDDDLVLTPAKLQGLDRAGHTACCVLNSACRIT